MRCRDGSSGRPNPSATDRLGGSAGATSPDSVQPRRRVARSALTRPGEPRFVLTLSAGLRQTCPQVGPVHNTADIPFPLEGSPYDSALHPRGRFFVSAPDRATIGVAVAGFGWMGRVHTQAYARILHHYPDAAPGARAGRGRRRGARPRRCRPRGSSGSAAPYRDWRELADDPDVAAVSITAPNFLHREIGVAMAEAGKHIWIEKPVGLTIIRRARGRGRRACRRCAERRRVQLPQRTRRGRCPRADRAGRDSGPITHARFRFFSDYAAHPDGALSWRFETERGGNGVLGDLASHAVDLAALPARRHRVPGRRRRDLHTRAPAPDRRHQRPRPWRPVASWDASRTTTTSRLSCGSRSGARAVARGEPGRRGRAERLRVRDPRHDGSRLLGLPPDGRARCEHRRRLPGPGGAAPCSSGPGTATTPRSSRVRRRAWATTT